MVEKHKQKRRTYEPPLPILAVRMQTSLPEQVKCWVPVKLQKCVQIFCSNHSRDTSHPEVSLYFPQSIHTNAWVIPSSGHNQVVTNSLSNYSHTNHPANTTVCDTSMTYNNTQPGDWTVCSLKALQQQPCSTFYEDKMSLIIKYPRRW